MSNETNELIVSQRHVDNIIGDKIDERIDQHLSNDTEFEEYEENENQEDKDLLSELEAVQNFDVFDDLINKRIDLGDVIKWRVVKDGELIQTKSGKGSWDEIHKEFGRGTYQIRPRSQQLRKFLKTQTLTLADYSGDSSDIEQAKENSFDMASFLNHQREERDWSNQEAIRREEKAEARFDKQLAQMGQNNNSSGSSFEFMKMMMDQNNRQDEIRRQEQIRRDDQLLLKEEKAEARFEKILLSLSSNKSDDSKISAIDHFEKIRQAEKDAKEDARREFEEIEKKATAKAAEIAENNGEKSITEKGIEALMETAPLLAKIYAKNTGAAPAPTRRRVIPPKRSQNPIKVVGLNNENSNTVVNSQKTTKINESEADEKKVKAKAFILELCSPIILESIVAEQKADECAMLCTKKLADVEINSEIIKHIFIADDFIKFSKEQGLHELAIAHNKVEQLESWLKELYELLSKPSATKEADPQVVVVNSPTL